MFKETDNFAKITHLTHDLEKLAIFVSALPRPLQKKLFRELRDNEAKKLIDKMRTLKKCSRKKVDAVLKEFHDLLNEKKEIIFEDNKGRDFILGVLGEDRAKQLLGQIVDVGGNTTTLDSIELVDSRTLAHFLINEHPQTMALILAHTPADKRGETIRKLPEGLQCEVLLRMAHMDVVAPEIIAQLDDVIKTEISYFGVINNIQVGGIEAIAEMLNGLDQTTTFNILSRMEEKDRVLTEEIKKLMFTFNEILMVDNLGIQELLKTIDNRVLLTALKGADKLIVLKFTDNMSQRASELFMEDLNSLGRIRKEDQLKARQEIITVIKDLESRGKAIITRSFDEYI